MVVLIGIILQVNRFYVAIYYITIKVYQLVKLYPGQRGVQFYQKIVPKLFIHEVLDRNSSKYVKKAKN